MPRPSRLLAAALMAGGAIAASTQSSSAASRPPKLQYQISTLPNGLTVVLSEDHSTPIVHLQLVYHVGSKNEKAGRTGFAHLFEHLMFKGSKNVQPEAHTSMLASVGGQSNAYTTDDETVFWETVPAQPAAHPVAQPIAWPASGSTRTPSPTSATW
jgi:zinc protease